MLNHRPADTSDRIAAGEFSDRPPFIAIAYVAFLRHDSEVD